MVSLIEIANISISIDRKDIFVFVLALLSIPLMMLPGLMVVFLLDLNKDFYIPSGSLSLFGAVLFFSRYQECVYRKRLKNIKIQENNSTPAIFSAQSIDEVICWFKTNTNMFLPNRQSIRSILRLLKSPPEFDPQHQIFCAPLCKAGWSKNSASVSRLTAFLINKLKYQKSPAGNDEKKVS